MARNALLGIALLASLTLGGCAAGEEEEARAAEAQLASMRARNDSLWQARQARLAADSAARQDSAGQSTLAANTPAGVDSVPASVAEAAVADSIQRAREIEVMRETFAYAGGTRDPFNSLINASKAGPEISDLELVGVY
ncbi:MAG: hypothetical protein ACREX8_13895, partial [Gammaproteobacteria bacterium]